MQSQCDAIIELGHIDSRRQGIQLQMDYRLKRRRQRSNGDNWSPPDEDEGHNSTGEQEQHLQAQANVFTPRLNERLGDIREQEAVIQAICRDVSMMSERAPQGADDQTVNLDDQQMYAQETEELDKLDQCRLMGCANQADAFWVVCETGTVCNFCCRYHAGAYTLDPADAGTHGRHGPVGATGAVSGTVRGGIVPSAYIRVGLGRSPPRASGHGTDPLWEEEAANQADHAARNSSRAQASDSNIDHIYEEKVANRTAHAARNPPPGRGRGRGECRGGRSTIHRRDQGYVEPPVVEFMGVSDPDTLVAPDLTMEQVRLPASEKSF